MGNAKVWRREVPNAPGKKVWVDARTSTAARGSSSEIFTATGGFGFRPITFGRRKQQQYSKDTRREVPLCSIFHAQGLVPWGIVRRAGILFFG